MPICAPPSCTNFLGPLRGQVSRSTCREEIVNRRSCKRVKRTSSTSSKQDNTSPIPVPDATVLARMCHGVLFVVRAAVTAAAVSQKACHQLQGANIVGVVLNSAEDAAGSGSYYQYSGYGLGQSISSQK